MNILEIDKELERLKKLREEEIEKIILSHPIDKRIPIIHHNKPWHSPSQKAYSIIKCDRKLVFFTIYKIGKNGKESESNYTENYSTFYKFLKNRTDYVHSYIRDNKISDLIK